MTGGKAVKLLLLVLLGFMLVDELFHIYENIAMARRERSAGGSFSKRLFFWIPIFILNLSWLIYALISPFRSLPDGSSLYFDNELLSWRFILSKFASDVCYEVSVHYVGTSGGVYWLCAIFSIFSFLLALLAWVCLARDFQQEKGQLVSAGYSVDVWFLRLVMHNAMCLTLAQTFIQAVYHVINLVFWGPNNNLQLATVIWGGLLLLGTLVYFVLDMGWLDQHQRYVVTPYLAALNIAVVLWGLVTFLAFQLGGKFSLYIVYSVFLAVTVVLAVVKLIVLIVRAVRGQPLDTESQDKGHENPV